LMQNNAACGQVSTISRVLDFFFNNMINSNNVTLMSLIHIN